jgi:hypothetical protein
MTAMVGGNMSAAGSGNYHRCSLANGTEMEFHLGPTSKQPQNLYDMYLMVYLQSYTPDDGLKDHPKHIVLSQNKMSLRYCAPGWFYYRNIL